MDRQQYSFMKGNRKKREKKNLFEQEDQENQPQPQSASHQPNPNAQIDPYNPAKLEENQIYINKTPNREGLFKFDMNEEHREEEEEKVKKEKPKKKKQLFVDSDEEEQEVQGEISNQLERTDAFMMPAKNKTEEMYKSEESVENSDKEESQERETQIRQMVQQKKQTKTEEISLQLAINEAGKDEQKRKKLLVHPLEPGCKAIFYFKRNSSTFSETYQLLGEDERPLIFCENQRGSIGANLYFSLTKEMNKKSSTYLGKLRGNAAGSTYQLFDHGLQPSKNIEKQQWRASLAYIDYQNNFMGINGPRKFKVILPNVQSSFELNPFRYEENENLSMFKAPFTTVYKNKQPRWNQRLKSYALNFGGRVKQASIKNFILVQDSKIEQVTNKNLLVFGKIDESTFSLQFNYPLSPLQAFAIAVSQFDFKLNCE